jgi:hypothetical protein
MLMIVAAAVAILQWCLSMATRHTFCRVIPGCNLGYTDKADNSTDMIMRAVQVVLTAVVQVLLVKSYVWSFNASAIFGALDIV